ncbi:MAG TPA: hypothetical protein VIG08_13660 [Gemmatimonadales bacterium]|jgi:hypothetical protein
MNARPLVSLSTIAVAAALMAAAPDQPTVSFSAVAGLNHYAGGGHGRCGRETAASLYEKPATLFLIEYGGEGSGDLDRVNLTLWQFKDGSADQLSLAFDAGKESYNISTVQGSKVVGKGSATVTAAGAGGKIVVKGLDARGVPIQMTVECAAFSGIEAEGG